MPHIPLWVQPHSWNTVLLAGNAASSSKGKALISVSDKTGLAKLAKVSSRVTLPLSEDILSNCNDH